MATMTLPGSWYGDAGVFEVERRRIFGRSWLFIGLAEALRSTGDYVATNIAGWNLVVVVGDDGQLHAHHNVCRHRAGPLVHEGTGHVPSLVCRYHGWAYALDGQLRSARDFGEDLSCDGITLAPVRVETWRGLVFVNVDLEGDAPPLVESLGTFADACAAFPIETFTHSSARTYDLACNWKTYADNYLEGYHIPLVHPGLNKEIDAKRYEVVVDEEFRWVEQHAPPRDGSVIAGRWLWRWPNLALNLCPDAVTIERYEPVDSRGTRLRYTYAFARPDDEDEILRLSDEVTSEDVGICEAVQRNLDTGVYQEGWLSPRHEGAVAAFQSWVREALS